MKITLYGVSDIPQPIVEAYDADETPNQFRVYHLGRDATYSWSRYPKHIRVPKDPNGLPLKYCSQVFWGLTPRSAYENALRSLLSQKEDLEKRLKHLNKSLSSLDNSLALSLEQLEERGTP